MNVSAFDVFITYSSAQTTVWAIIVWFSISFEVYSLVCVYFFFGWLVCLVCFVSPYQLSNRRNTLVTDADTFVTLLQTYECLLSWLSFHWLLHTTNTKTVYNHLFSESEHFAQKYLPIRCCFALLSTLLPGICCCCWCFAPSSLFTSLFFNAYTNHSWKKREKQRA